MVVSASSPSSDTFQVDYANHLIKRVVNKLRRSAKNRSRAKYARAYRLAADAIARQVKTK